MSDAKATMPKGAEVIARTSGPHYDFRLSTVAHGMPLGMTLKTGWSGKVGQSTARSLSKHVTIVLAKFAYLGICC